MHKVQSTFTAVALAMAMITPASAGSAPTANVTITLSNVVAAKGDLYVSLQKRDEFLQERGSYGKIIKTPAAGKSTVVLEGVSHGEYSVSVWHDIDGDMKFSRAANGMPLDGWSMVGAKQMRAEPKWEQAKFSVTATGAALALDMVYAK